MLARRLRGAALLPAGAYAVHQLRYFVTFGGHAEHELAAQGHAYLTALTAPIALLCAAAVGCFVGRLAQAWRGAAPGQRNQPGVRRVWLTTAALLVLIYVGQELLEGFLTTGHPGGLIGVFGAGGWSAVPLAVIVGGLIALALWAGHRALAFVGGLRRASRPRPRRRVCTRRPRSVMRPRTAPLATKAAGRAPPLVPLLLF